MFHSLNVALEKKVGVRLLSRLRTIHILESDFNTGYKLHIAQRTMDNALQHGIIPDAQYAKKRSQAIEAVLMKRLVYDYMRIKTTGVVISNDARGCFDRMALPIGLLVLQQLGTPKQVIRSLMTTLSSMKHYVRTAHGDLDGYYTGTKTRTLQGGGQGNGAAGPMWIAISIVLISIMSTLPITLP